MHNTLGRIEREEIGTRDRRKRKVWMTDEILQLIEERRKHKNKNPQRYREINRDIQRNGQRTVDEGKMRRD